MSIEVRIGFWLGLIVIIGWLLFLLAPVLTPFLAAALLAYLGDPLIDRLETYKLSRTAAVVAVFVTMIMMLLVLALFFIPLLEGQFSALMTLLPDYFDVLKTQVLPWLQQRLDIAPGQYNFDLLKNELSRHLNTVGGLIVNVLSSLGQSSAVVLGWAINIILIPVVTFYLLRDWDVLIAKIHDLLPRSIAPTVTELAVEADEVLGAFLKGQFVVMLALGAIYTLGLFFVGLDFALLIGMTAGIVSFVPYLGLIIGLSAAIIATLFQFQDIAHLIGVLAVFGFGQLIEMVWLTPTLVGDRIGLHPVAVIFAVLAGGYLFGFFGVLLALPAAAVIMVAIRHSHEHYLTSTFYND